MDFRHPIPAIVWHAMVVAPQDYNPPNTLNILVAGFVLRRKGFFAKNKSRAVRETCAKGSVGRDSRAESSCLIRYCKAYSMLLCFALCLGTIASSTSYTRHPAAEGVSCNNCYLDAARAGQPRPIMHEEVKELAHFHQEKDDIAAKVQENHYEGVGKMFRCRGKLVKRAIGGDEVIMWYQETCEAWEAKDRATEERSKAKKSWRCIVM